MNHPAIAMHDLHALTKSSAPALSVNPRDVHFTAQGWQRIGAQGAEKISAALKQPATTGQQ